MANSLASVAIDNFHVMDAIGRPDKTQPERVVDANAVLAFQLAQQSFQPVARRAPQCIQSHYTVCR